jgi:hypothetical protein
MQTPGYGAHTCTPACVFLDTGVPRTTKCRTSGVVHSCHADCPHVVSRSGSLVCTLTRVVFEGTTRAGAQSGSILGAGAMGGAEDRKRSVARFKARKHRKWTTDGGTDSKPASLPAHKLSVLASKPTTLGLVPIAAQHRGTEGAATSLPMAVAVAVTAPVPQAQYSGAGGGSATVTSLPTIAQVRKYKAGKTLSFDVAQAAATVVLHVLSCPEQLQLNTQFMSGNAISKAVELFLEKCSNPKWVMRGRAETAATFRAVLWQECAKRGVWAYPPSPAWLAALATLVATNYVAYTDAQNVQAAAGGRSACNLFPLTVREFTLACLRVFKKGFKTKAGVEVGPVNGLEFLPIQFPKCMHKDLLMSSTRPHPANRYVSSFLQEFSTACVDFPVLQTFEDAVGRFPG